MSELKIDSVAIDSCMKTSFDMYDDWSSENKLFQADRDQALNSGIVYNPSITINS